MEPGVEQQRSLEAIRLHHRAEPRPIGREARLLQGPGGGGARAAQPLLGRPLQGARRRPVQAAHGQPRAREAEHGEQQRKARASHQSTAPVQATLPMNTHSVAFRSGTFESTRKRRTVPRTDHCAPRPTSTHVVVR